MRRRLHHLVLAGIVAATAAAGAQRSPGEPDRDLVARAGDLLRRNANAEVVALLEPALHDGHFPSDSSGELHFTLAEAYRGARYPEARIHYGDAIDAARKTHDRAREARALRALAQLDKNQGAYEAGLSAGRQALDLYQALGDERNAALASIVLGAIHDSVGDPHAALEAFTRAVPAIGGESTANAANLMNEIGVTHKNLGHYAEAARWYERGLAIAEQLQDVGRQAMLNGNLSVLHKTMGDDERAVEYGQRSLTLVRQADNRRGEMIALLNLANAYWGLGDRRRAADALRDDLSVAVALGARSEEATLHKNLGDVDAAGGDLAGARREYELALAIRQAIGERRTEGAVLIAMADLARRDGHATDALELAERGVSLARETSQPELEWQARRELAAAAADAGQIARAIEELRASGAIVNTLRANVAGDASRIAYVDRRQSVFEQLATLLIKSGRAGDALEAAEAGRARAFADLLEQRQAFAPPPPATAAPRAGTAAERTSAGETGTRSARSSIDSRAAAGLPAEPADGRAARGPSAAEIGATAARLDATVIEYLVTDAGTFGWVVQPDGSIHVAALRAGREQLESLTRTVRSAIESSPRSAAGHGSLDAALRELNRLLIAPLSGWLPRSPAARVIVVPHGPLAVLPFAALTDSAGRPLIVRHTLVFAPAAAVYAYTRDKARAAGGAAGALVVADPLPPADSAGERLRWAREEGRQVASRMRAGPVRLLTDRGATESAVKRLASQYAVVHLATHGLIAPEQPFASSLLLAEGDGEDGYLRVDEIFSLDLRANLVVLSGCSTGAGKLTGDGIVGLTRAFLYAGASTVVVSQWNVSDRATSRLMDRFYAERQRGVTTARAMRRAALSMRRLGADISSWAAFEVVGEP